MANLRRLKKELALVLEIIVEECFIVCDLYPEKTAEAEKLISEAVALYKKSRSKHKKDASISAKKFYTEVRNTYVENMFEILKRIESLHENK